MPTIEKFASTRLSKLASEILIESEDIREEDENPASPLGSPAAIMSYPASPVKSPSKRRQKSLASLEELRAYLADAETNLNAVDPKKLRLLRNGEELRDLLLRVRNEVDGHYEKICSHMPQVANAVAKLRISVSKAIPLIVQIQSSKYKILVNKTYKRDTQYAFQDINSSFTSLLMGLSMAIASNTSSQNQNNGTVFPEEIIEDEELDGFDDDEMLLQGDRYYFGHGLEQSYTKAIQCYLSAVKKGNNSPSSTKAMICLASIYQSGYGVLKDSKQAQTFLEGAATLGDPEAVYRLGEIIYEQASESKDTSKYGLAMANFKAAADSGNHHAAEAKVGLFYEKGYLVGNVPDYEAARTWYERSASGGNADGQMSLGSLYFRGLIDGCEEGYNYEKAVSLFRRASVQDHSVALNNYGMCVEAGHGIKADLDFAISLYRRSIAKTESANAMCNLAFALLKQSTIDGVIRSDRKALQFEVLQLLLRANETNDEEIPNVDYGLGLVLDGHAFSYISDTDAALRHYEKAAARGHDVAAISAARICYDRAMDNISRHNEREYYLQKAHSLYTVAAKLNNAEAHNALGIMYDEGEGCRCNPETAVEHFAEAAALNLKDGHYNLARMLKAGRGVSKNIAKATRHFELAEELQ